MTALPVIHPLTLRIDSRSIPQADMGMIGRLERDFHEEELQVEDGQEMITDTMERFVNRLWEAQIDCTAFRFTIERPDGHVVAVYTPGNGYGFFVNAI